jgi:hypothetical protein
MIVGVKYGCQSSEGNDKKNFDKKHLIYLRVFFPSVLG